MATDSSSPRRDAERSYSYRSFAATKLFFERALRLAA